MSIEKVIYRAKAKATGGRDGRATSSDGVLDVKLGLPKEMGGQGGAVTNPEQLFAAGYSACFLGALKHVAAQDKTPLPVETFIEGSVAEELVRKAHVVCPYSNATRNNIDVDLQVITG